MDLPARPTRRAGLLPPTDQDETSPEKDVGAGGGGADASGAGNILAGMQPSTAKESGTERRHD